MTTRIRPDNARPRAQHYYFAHQYLRDNALTASEATCMMLRGDGAVAYLRTLWMTLGLEFRESGDDLIEGNTIDAFPFEFKSGWAGAVIRFPLPDRQAEAYFAAACFKSSSDHGDAPLACRYFTLERGGREGETVLGEWHGDMHVNLGDGPPPDADSFTLAVAQILESVGSLDH